MDQDVQSRQSIAEDAEAAALRALQFRVEQPNPHEQGTEAHLLWQTAYTRYLRLHTSPEGEQTA